jgi:membrane protease YdiL (CAAX protease family)
MVKVSAIRGSNPSLEDKASMDINLLISHLSEWLGVIAILMIVERVTGVKPVPVVFQYPQREKWYSLAVFGLASFFSIFFFFKKIAIPLDLAVEIDPPLVTRLVVSGLSLAVIALALFYRRQPALSAGWGHKKVARGALRLGLALVFLTIFLRGKAINLLNGVTAAEGAAFLLWLGISFAEESVFRGYLQLRFNAWVGERFGWLLTALLYFLWQIPFYLQIVAGSWEKIIIAAVQSLILGWIMRKSGHVLAPFLYHAFSEWVGLL